MTGTPTKVRPNSNHAFWSLQSGQLENRISQTVSPKMRSFHKTDSPRAKRRVHCTPFGESIGRFWRVFSLSQEACPRKIADSCPASLTQIASLCFEESILVFIGVCVCSVPNEYDEVETHIFILGNLVPVQGAVSWQSVCELQGDVFCSETSNTQNLESQVAFIQSV